MRLGRLLDGKGGKGLTCARIKIAAIECEPDDELGDLWVLKLHVLERLREPEGMAQPVGEKNAQA